MRGNETFSRGPAMPVGVDRCLFGGMGLAWGEFVASVRIRIGRGYRGGISQDFW